MGIRETEFQQYLPRFNEKDAAKFFGEHGEIVSMECEAAPNDMFVVAFATRLRAFGPMTVNRLVVETLVRSLAKLAGMRGI